MKVEDVEVCGDLTNTFKVDDATLRSMKAGNLLCVRCEGTMMDDSDDEMLAQQ